VRPPSAGGSEGPALTAAPEPIAPGIDLLPDVSVGRLTRNGVEQDGVAGGAAIGDRNLRIQADELATRIPEVDAATENAPATEPPNLWAVPDSSWKVAETIQQYVPQAHRYVPRTAIACGRPEGGL